jgi:transcriptional regulator with PAS, ATPase and Fis domain
MMERAAASPLPVLIEGESGTGKELVARALHFNSPRRARVFLSENCAAIPEALLESELFGYAQGAFTGADRDKKGLYEMADGGTLFLDEIGDMPFPMQAKLLRVLQDGEYRPIGGKEARKASVRILAATNADLRARIADGRFREDLYYRLNVISISLPPLRVRKEDIPALATHFLEKAARDRGLPRMTLEDELLTLLVRYNWPGNVRQLENVISRLGVLSRSAKLTVRDLESDPSLYQTFTEIESPLPSPIEDLSTLEKRQIQKALHETKGNRVKAAALIGISRATIFRKIKEYRIE